MSNQVIDRSYQLALHAAMREPYEQFADAIARLRTLDRHGGIEAAQYLALEAIAQARAGHLDEAEATFSRLGNLDAAFAQETKQRLLEHAPEAEHAEFREFVERVIPDPPSPDDPAAAGRGRPWWMHAGVGALAGALLVGLGVFLLIPRDSEIVGPPQSILGRALRATTESPKTAASATDLAQLYQQMERAVGTVVQRWHLSRADGTLAKYPVSRGTGFVVSRDGLILTNRHVIEGGAEAVQSGGKLAGWEVVDWDIVVVFGNEDPLVLEGGLVQLSAAVDLAWIRVDHQFSQVLAFGDTPRPGQTVLAYGFPGAATEVAVALNKGGTKQRYQILRAKIDAGEEPDLMEFLGKDALVLTVTKGIISAVRDTEAGLMLQTDTAIHRGSSGGPVVDETGRVVGIATLGHSKVQSANFCLAGRTVFEELARESGIVWPDDW